MSLPAFFLIIISAVMHAFWNLLVKRSRHKSVFIWWMFAASGSLFTLSLPLAPDPFVWPETETLLMIIVGAVCFVLYHLFNGRAYRGGDLSIVYPLSQTSMIWVPLWGKLLLGERLSFTGTSGILLVLLGVYAMQLRRLSLGELFLPFQDLGDPSVRAALMAGFIYSIGSVAEKNGVHSYSPFYFTYLLVLIMFLLMTVNICRSCYRYQIGEELLNQWKMILMSGPIMMASFLTFRYGLNLSPVSYAVPVRQISVMVGVLIGVLFLKESFGRIRLISALLIFLGALVIRFG
jgi:drug/metabolite transporter (DMT)-like permease